MAVVGATKTELSANIPLFVDRVGDIAIESPLFSIAIAVEPHRAIINAGLIDRLTPLSLIFGRKLGSGTFKNAVGVVNLLGFSLQW